MMDLTKLEELANPAQTGTVTVDTSMARTDATDMSKSGAELNISQPAAVPAEQQMVIGFPDPNAVFSAFCDREGYPSDGDMDEPLRKAFWEAVRMFSGDIPEVSAPPPAGELPVLPEPLQIDWPTAHSVALGCGIEDRSIYNRYEAAEYGFEYGVQKTACCIPDVIYTAEQMREYGRLCLATHQPAPVADPDSMLAYTYDDVAEARQQGRAAGLEEAANECERKHVNGNFAHTHREDCADAIRALNKTGAV